MIDNTGFDKSAQFEQMMPVAPVAREPRRIEAQDSPDLASAEPGDQTVEAGPRYRSTRRSPEIVIDNLDVDKAVATCDVDQIILAPLAFQIGHDLGLRGLAYIHDRLALKHGHREISACHRQAPLC
ncbi:hypothetical protein RLPCCGM1_p0531 [Rhizobium leguminosarum bv. phaseoli CCGM1]|nr:hypothetical protein RLPCCGM1_p0531 [Rhizobium leguminosarum bv. phaseoli CCGM1]